MVTFLTIPPTPRATTGEAGSRHGCRGERTTQGCLRPQSSPGPPLRGLPPLFAPHPRASPAWQQWSHRWSCSSRSLGRTVRSSSSSAGPQTAASTAEEGARHSVPVGPRSPWPPWAPASPVASCYGGPRPAPGSGASPSVAGRRRSCPR